MSSCSLGFSRRGIDVVAKKEQKSLIVNGLLRSFFKIGVPPKLPIFAY